VGNVTGAMGLRGGLAFPLLMGVMQFTLAGMKCHVNCMIAYHLMDISTVHNPYLRLIVGITMQ